MGEKRVGKMRKFINHIRRWNIWRKHNANGKMHKFIVLIGLIKSPTFGITLLPEELDDIQSGFYKTLNKGE